MEEIRDIATAAIDPDSTVNVRRSKVEEAVELVKSSIAKNDYWSSSPIIVRPHPDRSSHFEYEVVVGQCRLRACLELGIEEIPAVVQDMDNDAALKQSWGENEFSSGLPIRDKAYWIHKILLRYTGEGRSLSDAREIAAKFFNISPSTVITYHPLIGLPEEAKTMLEEGSLQLQDATVIAQHTHDHKHPWESDQTIMERIEWITDLNVDERKAARKAISKLGHKASVEQLDKFKENELDRKFATVKVEVPTDLHGRLIDWGAERGLIGVSESVIISHMIAEVLRRGE